jgi:hypothetical protein
MAVLLRRLWTEDKALPPAIHTQRSTSVINCG